MRAPKAFEMPETPEFAESLSLGAAASPLGAAEESAIRKDYHSPTLVTYGSISQLTKAGISNDALDSAYGSIQTG